MNTLQVTDGHGKPYILMNASRLTAAGWAKVVESAPGHVATVREYVIDALTDEQVSQLGQIADAVLHRLDPDGARSAIYERYDG